MIYEATSHETIYEATSRGITYKVTSGEVISIVTSSEIINKVIIDSKTGKPGIIISSWTRVCPKVKKRKSNDKFRKIILT